MKDGKRDGEEKIKERDFWVTSGKVKSKVSPEERMRGMDGGIGRRERTLGRAR